MTRYSEAVPLRNISAKTIVEALFHFFSRVGIQKEILTIQGTSFLSRTLKELYKLMDVQSVKISLKHHQADKLGRSAAVYRSKAANCAVVVLVRCCYTPRVDVSNPGPAKG